MKYISEIMKQHPSPVEIDPSVLAECIEACFDCEQACTACADACLAQEKVADLRHCIRTDLDCADICGATGRILSRQTKPDWIIVRGQVQALAQATKACGDECEQHKDVHDHCRTCMEACRRCEESCRRLLKAISAHASA